MAQATDPSPHDRPFGDKVLIVDDDDGIRHLLHVMFQGEGFNVVGEAGDGATALLLAIRLEPDIIVLDFMMPMMDGADTALLLRRLLPECRIVAFSAVLEEEPEWADAYLNKERVTEIVPLLRLLMEREPSA